LQAEAANGNRLPLQRQNLATEYFVVRLHAAKKGKTLI
jgi:hypothetical protein